MEILEIACAIFALFGIFALFVCWKMFSRLDGIENRVYHVATRIGCLARDLQNNEKARSEQQDSLLKMITNLECESVSKDPTLQNIVKQIKILDTLSRESRAQLNRIELLIPNENKEIE